jgi:predicted RNase H-like nuclease (RuvC/YqgF family)
VSDVVEESDGIELPPAWVRLEAAVEETVAALELWRRRAEQAEAEVTRLREALEMASLEAVSAEAPSATDAARQVRRLQAENTALRSRMAQAQRRIEALLSWTEALESPE